jgi:hypothetical protein
MWPDCPSTRWLATRGMAELDDDVAKWVTATCMLWRDRVGTTGRGVTDLIYTRTAGPVLSSSSLPPLRGIIAHTHTRSFTMHGLIMFSPLPLPTQTSKCLRGIRNIHFTASSSVSFVVLVVQVSITGEYFSLVHLFNYTITTYYHTLSGRIRQ